MARDRKKRGSSLEQRKATSTPEANLVLRRSMQHQFLEAYEARQASDRIDQLASTHNIPWKELQVWLKDDPDFVASIAEIDNRRISLVRNIFVTDLEEIANKTVEIAKGDGRQAIKAQQLVYEVVGIMAGRRGQGVSIFNKIEVGADQKQAVKDGDLDTLKERLASVQSQLAEFEDIPNSGTG